MEQNPASVQRVDVRPVEPPSPETGIAAIDVRKCPIGATDNGPLQLPAQRVEGPLSAAQRQAIQLLAAGSTFGQAAMHIGINERTLYRWRHDPVFLEALDRAVDETVCDLRGCAVRLLKKAMIVATQELSGVNAMRVALRLVGSRGVWQFVRKGRSAKVR